MRNLACKTKLPAYFEQVKLEEINYAIYNGTATTAYTNEIAITCLTENENLLHRDLVFS